MYIRTDDRLAQSWAYRIFIGTSAVIILCLTFCLILTVYYTHNRPGNSTRRCALGHCFLTGVACVYALVVAVLQTQDTNYSYAIFAVIIAVAQGIGMSVVYELYICVCIYVGIQHIYTHTHKHSLAHIDRWAPDLRALYDLNESHQTHTDADCVCVSFHFLLPGPPFLDALLFLGVVSTSRSVGPNE